ncbi:hypothetical protein L195_g052598, partial [Trifolium pratense]
TTQKDALVADVWNPINNTEDMWGWLPENVAVFSVKSTYCLLSKLSEVEVLEVQGNARIFSSIWNCPAPSKAGADSSCVFCDEELESASHLFIYCEFVRRVWTEIFDWLDVPFSLPHNLFSIFNCLMSTGVRKLQKGTGVVAELVEGVKLHRGSSGWRIQRFQMER